MSTACDEPLDVATHVEYWLGELSRDAEAAYEEHLMRCGACAAESARVAAIIEALREELPPVIGEDVVARLRGKGLRVAENPMGAGEHRDVVFPRDADLLVHRLGGLDLSETVRVDFTLRVASTGEVLVRMPGAPFDRERGEILVPCQRHFSVFPPDTVAEVTQVSTQGPSRVVHYGILHVFE